MLKIGWLYLCFGWTPRYDPDGKIYMWVRPEHRSR